MTISSYRDQAKAWYRSKQWAALRQQTLARDKHLCQSCGRPLTGQPMSPDSPVVNHIQPHRGNRTLFFNSKNLQSVCKQCHDSAVQASERREYTIGCDAKGNPIDNKHWWNTSKTS